MNEVGVGKCVVARHLVLSLEAKHLSELVLVPSLEKEKRKGK